MNNYTLFRFEGNTNNNYTYGDIYGMLDGAWQRIHSKSEWNLLNAYNKQNIFRRITGIPSGDILTKFAPFSLLNYSINDQQKYFNINYIPKPQLIIMKDFINLSRFNRILNIEINTTEINGLIYVVIANGNIIRDANILNYITADNSIMAIDEFNDGTIDTDTNVMSVNTNEGQYNNIHFVIDNSSINSNLLNDNIIFYTLKTVNENNVYVNKWTPAICYNNEKYFFINSDTTSLDEIQQNINTDIFGKLTCKQLQKLEPQEIDKLLNITDTANYNKVIDEQNNINKLGFAFLFVPFDNDAQLYINNIIIHTDMNGIWESTAVNVDYKYSYPDDSSIAITFLNAGKYKINYSA